MGAPLRAATRAIALFMSLLLIALGVRPAIAHTEPVTVLVSIQPAEPVLNEEVEMRVILLGARSGLPLLGAEVAVIADMPVHKMTPLKAALFRGQKRNEHVGKLSFTMVGPWEVTVDVFSQGERDQAKFNVEVKIPTTERDEGIATYTLTLNFPVTGFAYREVVLLGSVLLMAAIVEAAWINKNSKKARQLRGGG